MQAELAPLDIWIKFSLEYYRSRKFEQFKQILNEYFKAGKEGSHLAVGII